MENLHEQIFSCATREEKKQLLKQLSKTVC